MTDALQLDDTIAAVASAPGPGMRGIVRLSGGSLREVLSNFFEPHDAREWLKPQARRHPGLATLTGLHLPLSVDVLLWPTSRSYTGEPLAEVHLIGSPPLVDAVLSAAFVSGARPAQRGEFTLRAFLAGRIDLLQAEAVLGVIDADDQQQLAQALSQLGGGISTEIGQLHEELLLHLADLEAGLDFVEEGIEFITRDELARRLSDAMAFLDGLMTQADARMQSTGRRRVVLAGLPNAGKSTLFNALVSEQRALVSPAAGTTRDYLVGSLDCEGVSVDLVDTAGWDTAATGIEKSADSQRQQQWNNADLIVWCTEAGTCPQDRLLDTTLRNRAARTGTPFLLVLTKSDEDSQLAIEEICRVSALSGDGLQQLRHEIANRLVTSDDAAGLLGTTTARCRDSLQGAHAALVRAHEVATINAGDEIIAVELRTAIDELGKVAGRTYTDDVLDRIFSRFCIGK